MISPGPQSTSRLANWAGAKKKAWGVAEVSGDFERGDAVEVRTKDGQVVGKGLSAYAAADMRLIKGHKSEDIEKILGYRGRSEVIHRDDLVIG